MLKRTMSVFSIFGSALFAIGICSSASAQAQTPASLNDLWAGNAKWTQVNKWTDASPKGASGNVSSKIRVLNGTWYLFQREVQAGSCAGSSPIALRVYKSIDKGLSWTASSQLAIQPVAGTDFACGVTDGDAVYDANANKWRGLFQCRGGDNRWRGCYFEMSGSDATASAFDYQSPSRQTAVIQPGALWSKICNSAGDSCYGKGLQDEGTFDIFRQDTSGYFWVAFHGYNAGYGYRGIAKTTDFVNWVAGDSAYGLPVDATMGPRDATAWREAWAPGGNIGAGHGSILEDGGYTYAAVEFADMNLACTPGQHFDIGLFRTSSLTATQWSQYPLGNPVMYSSTAIEPVPGVGNAIRPCNLQYPQIFMDASVSPPLTYLKFGRETYTDSSNNGTFLYRLDKVTNLLKNGNLWMADSSYWNRLPGGAQTPNMAVYRLPNLSPDGNQFLATNCAPSGSSCVPDSSIYQDVSVAGYAGRSIKFGGEFATLGGDGGSPSIALFQFDANSNVLKADSLTLSTPDSSYRSFTSPAVFLLPNASSVRYQFYHPRTGITYTLGNMFINVQ